MKTLNKPLINTLYHELYNHLSAQVYWVDEHGHYLGCNQQYCNFLKQTTEANLVGKNVSDFLTTLGIRTEHNDFQKGIFERTYFFQEEPPIIFKVIETTACEVTLIIEENFSQYLSHIKQLENKCSYLETHKNQTETYLNNLIQIVPASIYWKDINSVILGSNITHATLAGFSKPEDVIGKTEYDFVWKHQAASIIENDHNIMNSGKGLKLEETATLNDGELHTFLTSKEPLRDKDHNIIGIIGISLDITDRKKMEKDLENAKLEAEAANQAKSDFMANISHDIRTPLTGVIGMAKMLEEQVPQQQHKQCAQWLGESGTQLLHMLNEILELIAADQVNEKELHEEPFNIYQLIQNISELVKPSTITKGLQLVTHIDDNIPLGLISDQVKIHRILLNLVGNAIKFTQQGHIEIKVKLKQQVDKQVLLQFCVTDTGIGIPQEYQNKIFERFYRVTPSYKGIYTGQGLGLHIVQTYLKLLGSEIFLTSQPDLGTTFYFDLLLMISENMLTSSLPKSEIISSPPLKSIEPVISMVDESYHDNVPHLLLVEDNKIALITLQSQIKRAGLQFTSAMDGESALDLAMHQSFDLIITDLGLPGLSGIELTEKLRHFESEQKKPAIPIIGLTAHAEDKIKLECLQAGMNEALTKPLTFDKLNEIKFTYFSVSPIPSSDVNHALINTLTLGNDLPSTEEELFKLENYPLLDVDAALKGFANNHDLLKNILQSMVDDEMPKDCTELAQAYMDGRRWDLIEKITHRMKGGLVYCGTVKLIKACQYLESYHKAGYQHALERLYQQLLNIIDQTNRAVREWIDSVYKFS